MNTNDIREHLLSRAPWVDRTRTVDTVKAGDPARAVRTVGVGWVSSIENLRRAHELGCDLFITHEPTFWEHAPPERHFRTVEPGLTKQRFLDETGMVVLRIHDVWDNWPGIGIRDSWCSFVGSARLSWFVDEAEHWNVFTGVSQGFRAPNLSDLSGSSIAKSGEQEVPSPGLDPEQYINAEIGVKAKYDDFAAQASYFYTCIDDMIVRVPNGNISPGGDPEVSRANAGDGYVQGIEVGASWRFCPQWTLFGTVAWTEGEADTYPTSDPVIKSEYLSRLMPTTTQIGLRWDHPDNKCWVETTCTFACKADKLSTSDEGDTQRIPPGGTPGHTVWDLRGGCKVCEDLDVWAGVENITNADYRTHGSGVNEPGTNFKVGAKWRF